MIAFGASISGAEAYRRYAEPGVRLAAEPDSEVFAFAAIEPVARTYNLILDAAAKRDDLEALVLVHPHTEIVDPGLSEKIRRELADPVAGVVGCAGATDVKSIAWWEGRVVSAPVVQRYVEFGGGEMPAYSWTERARPPADVETVDGQLLVLAPWVVRNLRFDESLIYSHGFDLDFCMQVRAAGRKVTVADIRVIHHRSVEPVADLDVWAEAHIRVAEKWGDAHPADDKHWKARARRAEAEREVARAVAFSESLKLRAHVQELERALSEKTSSVSWRVTEPLRLINHLRRRGAERRRLGGQPS